MSILLRSPGEASVNQEIPVTPPPPFSSNEPPSTPLFQALLGSEERFYEVADVYGIYVIGLFTLYLIYRTRGGLGFVKTGMAVGVMASMLWFFLHMGEVKRNQKEDLLKYTMSCVQSKHVDVRYCMDLHEKIRAMTTIGVLTSWANQTWEAVPAVLTPFFLQSTLFMVAFLLMVAFIMIVVPFSNRVVSVSPRHWRSSVRPK